MSIIESKWPLASGWPVLKYIGNENLRVLHSVRESGGAVIEVVGDPDNAYYEWGIRKDGKVTAHSEVGYNQANVALLDGLIEFHGLPEDGSGRSIADVAGALREALETALPVLDDGEADALLKSQKAKEEMGMARARRVQEMESLRASEENWKQVAECYRGDATAARAALEMAANHPLMPKRKGVQS